MNSGQPSMLYRLLLVLFLLIFCELAARAAQDPQDPQDRSEGRRVLVITAHPDDEVAIAGTIYKITHELHGVVDECVITNGEGGFEFATLASTMHGLDLTNEAVGRANLPRIRKQELLNAGRIIGLRNIFFLDQKDSKFGLDERETLDATWNVQRINARLRDLMTTHHYDYVFCPLPAANVHAHHKAATLLALAAVQALPDKFRPAILGFSELVPGNSGAFEYQQLKSYVETKVEGRKPLFEFDRRASFGSEHKLNYKIVANWEISEHKTQGMLQMAAMNQGDFEHFWFFAINRPAGRISCEKLFEDLNRSEDCPRLSAF